MKRALAVALAAATIFVASPGGHADATPTQRPAIDGPTALIQMHAANRHISFAQAKQELDNFFRMMSAPRGDGAAVARAALLRNGASSWAASQLVAICMRESHCRLGAHNYSRRTHDDSWGPWQINYWGRLRAGRTAAYGSGGYMTSSWDRAARAVLSMSNYGHNLCPWVRSCYS